MPVDLSYGSVFVNIFLRGGVFFAYLLLFGYRVAAASFLPCLRNVVWCAVSSIACVATLKLLPAFDEVSFWEGVYFFMLIPAPSIIAGIFEIVKKSRTNVVLISCAVESILFPIWFDMVFLTSLLFDTAD